MNFRLVRFSSRIHFIERITGLFFQSGIILASIIVTLITLSSLTLSSQCIPVSQNGFQENLLQAAFHTVLYKTPTGYAASGDGTNVDGQEQFSIQDIGYDNGYTAIPATTNLVWGTVGGHAQLVFVGDDDVIYAGGNENRVLDPQLTTSNTYGPTTLGLPNGITHQDIIKFQASNGGSCCLEYINCHQTHT